MQPSMQQQPHEEASPLLGELQDLVQKLVIDGLVHKQAGGSSADCMAQQQCEWRESLVQLGDGATHAAPAPTPGGGALGA